jgi:pimeloyl-ACP methyl ester carboxylesterase
MPFLPIPEGQIHYEVHGSGYPLLLFAPGFLSARIERWRTNPARPGVPQDWLDPIAALSDHFRVIAFDVRNAGESRARLRATDDWTTYTGDHLALLDHLRVERCHVMGACIGVSFALALAKERPRLVSAMVLQNPIGPRWRQSRDARRRVCEVGGRSASLAQHRCRIAARLSPAHVRRRVHLQRLARIRRDVPNSDLADARRRRRASR